MKLNDRIRLIPRKLQGDDRGWFLKVITGTEEQIGSSPGEVYLTMAKPGESRGGHYHTLANEWFTVFEGDAEVHLCDPVTVEMLTVILTAEEPQTLFVPAGVAHIFRNPAKSKRNFLMVAYTDRPYDPADTNQFTFPVMNNE